MTLGSAFFAALQRIPVKRFIIERIRQQLMAEGMKSCHLWAGGRETRFPFLGYKSTFFILHVTRLCALWSNNDDPVARGRYFCYVQKQPGELVSLKWADVLKALDDVVRQEGYSMNLEATFESLAHAVLTLAYWNGDNDNRRQFGQTEDTILRFIRLVSYALEAPPPPAPVSASLEAEEALGEESGEPQREAEEVEDTVTTTSAERSGQPQADLATVLDAIGEGSGEPQPEAAELGEGIAEHEPEAVQFGEGILEPQPEAEEIGEGILEHQPEAEEPATMTSVERSGARRRLTGVPMDTDAVRGVKRYRLRETYEREMARYKSARRRYDLRDTPTRQERLADMEQDLKRGRNVGSAQPRKRSRL